MKIKKAILKDIPIICRVYKQITLPNYDFKWDQKWWIEKTVRAGKFFKIDHKAFISLEGDGHELEITTLVISKRYHKKGYGKRLVEFAFKRAKNSGHVLVTVGSFIHYKVKDFYLNCGFKFVGEMDDAGGCPYYDFEYYLKSLS